MAVRKKAVCAQGGVSHGAPVACDILAAFDISRAQPPAGAVCAQNLAEQRPPLTVETASKWLRKQGLASGLFICGGRRVRYYWPRAVAK